MQTKFRTIALGVLGASLMMTARVDTQTALPSITVENGQQQGGAGGARAGGQTAPAADAAPAGAATATAGNPANAIDGYVAESTSTGTKTNTPLREIPQSVSVVTRDQIEDRQAQTLNDAIGYSAGIGTNPFGNDARFDQFIIRGFEQNTTGIYRDGLRLPVFSFTGFRIEPYVDHIRRLSIRCGGCQLMSPNVTDSPENRTDVYDNARLTPRGREATVRAVVDHGLTQAEAARRFNTSAKTGGKWVGRFRADGA